MRAIVLAVLLAGCTADATQIVVAIDTDLRTPDEVTTIQLDLTSPDGEMETRSFALLDAPLPATVAVLRDGPPFEPLVLTATALDVARPVVSATVTTRFEEGETRLVRIALLRACIGAGCPDAQTCLDPSGDCVPRDVTTEPFDGRPDRFAPLGDAGMPMDAAIDAGPPEDTGPPVDTGPMPDAGCTGCMRGGSCLPGNEGSACGSGGAECVTCECGTDTCESGLCAPARPVRSLASGLNWACFVVEDGTVYCMGADDDGQLGRGVVGPGDPLPGPAADSVGTGAEAFGGGDVYVAYLRSDGTAIFWGVRPGTGTARPNATSFGVTAAQLAAGGYHVCALTADGTLSCSGENDHGELGDGTLTSATSAFRTVSGTWTDVSGGLYHTCAIRGGELWCWGHNDHGQIGQGGVAGTPTHSAMPLRVGTDTNWVDIEAGKDFNCVRRTDSTVVCFGDNGSDQAGVTTPDTVTAPGAAIGIAGVPIADVVALDAGRFHACVLRGAERSLWCWGGNGCGELGDATMRESAEPRRVATVPGHGAWAELGLGHTMTCATRENGSLWCWGRPGSHLVISDTTCTAAEAITSPRRVCL